MLFFESRKKWLVKDLKELKSKFDYNAGIISSVKKAEPKFRNYLDKNINLIVLSHTTKIPITNLYKTPKTLGKDRLAAVIGAHKNYKGNKLVIDSGTCTKYDFIDKKGQYLGGNIAPGLEMRLQAMHHFTDKLPSVKVKQPKSILGTTTKEAINNGAVYGIILEIEAMISRLKAEKGQINVILTGGSASFLGQFVKSKIFVDTNLVMKGLNEIIIHQNSI